MLVDKAITELGQPAKGKFMYLLQMTHLRVVVVECLPVDRDKCIIHTLVPLVVSLANGKRIMHSAAGRAA